MRGSFVLAIALVTTLQGLALAQGTPGDTPTRETSWIPQSPRSARLLEPNPFDFTPLPELPQHYGFQLPEWANLGLLTVREAMMYFMAGFIPDPNGQEKPNPIEWPIDQFAIRVRDAMDRQTRFQILAQGVANLKYLGGSYYYTEIQTGAGVHIDLIDPNNPNAMLALRISPAYFEAAWIRLGTGAGTQVGGGTNALVPNSGALPSRFFLGSSVGVEASGHVGAFEPGARFYARPLWELGDEASVGKQDFGVSLYGSLYVRIGLNQLLGAASPSSVRMMITPTVAVFDRSTAIRDLTRWSGRNPMAIDPSRTVGDLTPIVQGTVYFDLRFNDPLTHAPRIDAFTGPR